MKINTIFDFTDSEPSPFPSVGKIKNKGFERLKNPILRHELERCNKTPYSAEKHLKIEDLGYKTLHQIDFLAQSRWIKYFSNGGKVYIQSRANNLPLSSQILFDNSILNYFGRGIPMPKKEAPIKRGWVKGGKGGKAEGFDFRIQINDKLSKKNRESLLCQSVVYINEIAQHDSSIDYLDESWSDFELLDVWNKFFENHGYRFPDFEEKWNRKYLGNKSDFGAENESLATSEIDLDSVRKKLGIVKKQKFDLTGMG
jgi:hypothetical protein